MYIVCCKIHKNVQNVDLWITMDMKFLMVFTIIDIYKPWKVEFSRLLSSKINMISLILVLYDSLKYGHISLLFLSRHSSLNKSSNHDSDERLLNVTINCINPYHYGNFKMLVPYLLNWKIDFQFSVFKLLFFVLFRNDNNKYELNLVWIKASSMWSG